MHLRALHSKSSHTQSGCCSVLTRTGPQDAHHYLLFVTEKCKRPATAAGACHAWANEPTVASRQRQAHIQLQDLLKITHLDRPTDYPPGERKPLRLWWPVPWVRLQSWLTPQSIFCPGLPVLDLSRSVARPLSALCPTATSAAPSASATGSVWTRFQRSQKIRYKPSMAAMRPWNASALRAVVPSRGQACMHAKKVCAFRSPHKLEPEPQQHHTNEHHLRKHHHVTERHVTEL